MTRSTTRRWRCVRHALIVVLLAFFVTIGSAWWIEWRAPAPTSIHMGMAGVPGFPSNWIERVPDDWGTTPLSTAFSVVGGMPNGSFDRVPRLVIGQGSFDSVSSGPNGVSYNGGIREQTLQNVEVGWPIHTFQRRGSNDKRPMPTNMLGKFYLSGIPVPGFKALSLEHARRLPLRPLWGRFFGTLVVYIVVIELLWRLITLRAMLRHRRRVKLRLCLACGYDIQDQDICPECGSVRAPSRSA